MNGDLPVSNFDSWHASRKCCAERRLDPKSVSPITRIIPGIPVSYLDRKVSD